MIPHEQQRLIKLAERLNQRGYPLHNPDGPPHPRRYSAMSGRFRGELVNPDGPEAATAIETLSERIAALEAENAHLSKAVCSGILGDLLAPDENEALLAFVKKLRASTPQEGKQS